MKKNKKVQKKDQKKEKKTVYSSRKHLKSISQLNAYDHGGLNEWAIALDVPLISPYTICIENNR